PSNCPNCLRQTKARRNGAMIEYLGTFSDFVKFAAIIKGKYFRVRRVHHDGNFVRFDTPLNQSIPESRTRGDDPI
ncbi:MAG: hypothetical protein ACYSOJ_06385, partial [Planctomycetota bacterium]